MEKRSRLKSTLDIHLLNQESNEGMALRPGAITRKPDSMLSAAVLVVHKLFKQLKIVGYINRLR